MSNNSSTEKQGTGWFKNSKKQKDIIDSYQKKVEEAIYPKTRFGTWVRFLKIPKQENNVLSFVYLGAAILVFVLGLRGLGTNIPPFLSFLTDSSGRVSSYVIFPALILECSMISWLAATMFFKLEEHRHLFSLVNGEKPDGKDGKPSGVTTILTENTYEQKIIPLIQVIIKLSHELSKVNQKPVKEILNRIKIDIDIEFDRLIYYAEEQQKDATKILPRNPIEQNLTENLKK